MISETNSGNISQERRDSSQSLFLIGSLDVYLLTLKNLYENPSHRTQCQEDPIIIDAYLPFI
jgi:hypothetical protein